MKYNSSLQRTRSQPGSKQEVSIRAAGRFLRVVPNYKHPFPEIHKKTMKIYKNRWKSV